MRAERHRQAKYMQVNTCRTAQTGQIHTDRCVQKGTGRPNTYRSMHAERHRQAKYIQIDVCRTAQTGQIHAGQCTQNSTYRPNTYQIHTD